eukprot:6186769-Pleurochrysis_carterae.AAC.1
MFPFPSIFHRPCTSRQQSALYDFNESTSSRTASPLSDWHRHGTAATVVEVCENFPYKEAWPRKSSVASVRQSLEHSPKPHVV